MKTRPFIFRLNAAEFFTQIQGMNDAEKAAFVTQFSIDLITLQGTSDYAKKVIDDTMQTIKTRRENGKKGGRPKTETKPKVISSLNKTKAKAKQEEEKEEEKIIYAESVKMTFSEFNKLVSSHGQPATMGMVEILSNYKVANGKKYASDYRAILNWVVDRWKKDNPNNKPKIDPRFQRGGIYEAY